MKYELTDEKIDVDGHTLYRIRALKDFGGIKAGELGGFIEDEKNLAQEGKAWVGTHEPIIYFFDNSMVYNIYNDMPEPETEHDFTSAELVPGLQLHNLFGGLLVIFPHWFATVIQRAFRRHHVHHTSSSPPVESAHA